MDSSIVLVGHPGRVGRCALDHRIRKRSYVALQYLAYNPIITFRALFSGLFQPLKEKAFVPTAVSFLIGAIFSTAVYILDMFGGLGLVIALFAIVVFIIAQTEAFLEIKAFRKTLIGVNDRLSRGWKYYWWVYLGLLWARVGSGVIGVFSETFYQISKVGWGFIGFVESIVLTIMVYRTAMAFKRVAQGDEESLLR